MALDLKQSELTEKTISTLQYISCKYEEEGFESFSKWYNLAYSVIYTKMTMGADILTIEAFCKENNFLLPVFNNVVKYYSIKTAESEKTTDIKQLIESDLSLLNYLIEKLRKEVKYYEVLYSSKKNS